MNEIWKDIDGYAGIYQVSSLGRTRSLDRTLPTARNRMQTFKGRILRPNIHKDGYHCRSLQKSGKIRIRLVHQLVASAFIGSCPDGMEVNHKDGDKSNNSYTNLEYVTASENCLHAHRTGLRNARKGSLSPKAVLNESCVREIISLSGKKTLREIAEKYNVDPTTIGCILSGKTWSHVTGLKLKSRLL